MGPTQQHEPDPADREPIWPGILHHEAGIIYLIYLIYLISPRLEIITRVDGTTGHTPNSRIYVGLLLLCVWTTRHITVVPSYHHSAGKQIPHHPDATRSHDSIARFNLRLAAPAVCASVDWSRLELQQHQAHAKRTTGINQKQFLVIMWFV